MRRALALAAAILVGAATGAAQTPAPAPSTPRPARTPKAKAAAKPPLDFSGVWVLDTAASSGVSPQMENAVLQVKQNGNRIWIEQIETPQRNILSEQIVVDGEKYEKSLGHGMKGTLEAEWGKDERIALAPGDRRPGRRSFFGGAARDLEASGGRQDLDPPDEDDRAGRGEGDVSGVSEERGEEIVES